MFAIRETLEFANWVSRLRDTRARARIVQRIDHSQGYRVYFVRDGTVVIVPLCGSDTRTQSKDIEQAKVLAKALKE
ncbi:type II toxin-antitoxin system RelE/ParE family toxin [Rhizobium rhizogenes]